MEEKSLFNNYKYCKGCKKPLPISYKGDLCPACLDSELFHQVKDYIREHTVNEFNVAQHFNIPVQRVKQWIRDGRIEYKELKDGTIAGMHCQACGAPIQFGTLCPKCLKIRNHSGHSTASPISDSNGNMHYLDKNR